MNRKPTLFIILFFATCMIGCGRKPNDSPSNASTIQNTISESNPKLPPATEITFDPKAVDVGDVWVLRGAMNEVKIKVLEQTGSICLIEYSNIGCGGVGIVERIELPNDAGVVKADFKNKHFPKTARIVYSRRQMGVRALVPGTDEFVEFDKIGPVSEMFPKQGDKIKFQYQVYDSPTFENRSMTIGDNRGVEFVVGSDQVWPWLKPVMEEMSVGDQARVQVPVKVAAGASKWLEEPKKSKMLYATIRLVSVERAK